MTTIDLSVRVVYTPIIPYGKGLGLGAFGRHTQRECTTPILGHTAAILQREHHGDVG
jgi:hypothetical protein